jgi:hypothetical protein
VVESREDGSTLWRSPLGRTYEVEPPPLVTLPTRATTVAAPKPKPPPETDDPPF